MEQSKNEPKKSDELFTVEYPYFKLSIEEKQTFQKLGIYPVKLSRAAIKRLNRINVETLAYYENCSIREIKEMLKENPQGGQLTRIESLLLISEITNLPLKETIDINPEGFLVVCIKK